MENRIGEFARLPESKIDLIDEDARYIDAKFSKTIKFIREALYNVRTNNREIQKLQDNFLKTGSSEQEKNVLNQANIFTVQNNALCSKIKEVLGSLSQDVDENRQKFPEEPETRMKILNYQAVNKEFSKILTQSQWVQVEFKKIVSKKISRQIKFIEPEISESEVEELCSNPQKAAEFVEQKLVGKGHTKLQNAVSDIQDKYRDIQRLESNVETLYNLIKQMAFLVRENSLTIDSIEMNVASAKNYMGKAVVRLVSAKEDDQSARKKQAIVFLVVLAVVGLILYLVLR